LFGMVCTLFQGAGAPVSFDALGAMLDRAGDAKVILVHACGARLLEVRELVAPFPNVLLDLSYTMFRYEGSSLDLDMRWLLANFDRRTCVGTDYPYRDLKALRARFRSLSSGLPAEKVKNVSYYNLQAFVEGVS